MISNSYFCSAHIEITKNVSFEFLFENNSFVRNKNLCVLQARFSKDLLYLSFVQKSSLVNLEIRRPPLLFYYTTSSSCLCPVPSVFLWLCFAGTHRGSSSSNPKADNLACHPSEILAILQLLHYSLHCSTQALQPYIGPAQ